MSLFSQYLLCEVFELRAGYFGVTMPGVSVVGCPLADDVM